MKTKVFALIFFLAAVSMPAFAQKNENRFGIEFNGDVSIVSSDLAGADLNTGLGFETVLHYRFMPLFGIYGGWGWSHFNANESFAGQDIDFEQTGYILGLQCKLPLGSSPVSYYARAGLLFSHIETEDNQGDIISDTGHGAGWQAATGIEVSMGKNWSLSPGVKFNYLSGETELEGVNYQLDHRYVSVRIGIIKRF